MTAENPKGKVAKKSPAIKSHAYEGYRITESGLKLDQVDISEINSENFIENYVKAHRPCVINGVIPELDVESFEIDNVEETLEFEGLLQVEKKVAGGYGSGQRRLKMSFGEFLTKLKNGEDGLYLTTQYKENDNDDEGNDEEEEEEEEEEEDEENEKGYLEDDDDDSIDLNDLHDDFVDSDAEVEELNNEADDHEEILQPPLTNLADEFPFDVIASDILKLQQVNLWIGSNSLNKEISGFENIGKNLPSTNGTSSGLHHDHSDNLYIPVMGKKRFTLFSPYDADAMYTVGDIYKVYDNGVIDYEINEKAVNWNHVARDGSVLGDIRPRQETELDPPSFSKIPPLYLHLDEIKDETARSKLSKEFYTKFPRLAKVHSIQVSLEKGQMLYLPCGWFHEVSSFGNYHVAINYWFAPVTGA